MEADSFSNSWEEHDAGKADDLDRIADQRVFFASVSGSTGYASPGIFSSARSRADIEPGSRLTGGAYFLTSALMRLAVRDDEPAPAASC